MILILDISNTFQDNILSYLEESIYLSLPHLYLEWFKRKWPKHALASLNKNEIFIKDIQWIKGAKQYYSDVYRLTSHDV